MFLFSSCDYPIEFDIQMNLMIWFVKDVVLFSSESNSERSRSNMTMDRAFFFFLYLATLFNFHWRWPHIDCMVYMDWSVEKKCLQWILNKIKWLIDRFTKTETETENNWTHEYLINVSTHLDLNMCLSA